MTSFVFPALFYLKLTGPPTLTRATLRRDIVGLLAIAAFGLLSIALGIVVHALELVLVRDH